LTPEDKVRVHKEIFTLATNTDGGYPHDQVYSMPVFLRYFYLKMLIEKREKEAEQAKAASQPKGNSPMPKNSPPGTINKPF
jgi:hypothetical protein